MSSSLLDPMVQASSQLDGLLLLCASPKSLRSCHTFPSCSIQVEGNKINKLISERLKKKTLSLCRETVKKQMYCNSFSRYSFSIAHSIKLFCFNLSWNLYISEDSTDDNEDALGQVNCKKRNPAAAVVVSQKPAMPQKVTPRRVTQSTSPLPPRRGPNRRPTPTCDF